MSQYGEPWRIEERTNSDYEKYDQIVDVDGREVTGASTCGGDCWDCSAYPSNNHERRIVACVNACREMDDDLVRDIDPPKLTAFVKAVGTLNPAGIPNLVSEVERVVAVMRANMGTYHDPTNILPTLETALMGVKP